MTLTFGSHQSGLPTSGIVQDLAKDFEAETGIKVDFQISPDAQWRDLIKVKLDSGEAPDIICVDLTDQDWTSRMEDSARSAVSADDKVYGITFPGAKMYFYLYPEIYDKLNANEVKLESIPHLLTIIEELDECAKAGYFGADYLSNTMENAKSAMASGEYGMVINEMGFRGEVEADYPDFKATEELGAFVMPWGDNQVIGVNPASNAYFINKESKYTEEAKQFFEFLARPENLQKRLEGQPELNALCWPEVESKYSEEDQAFIDSLEKANVVQTSVNYIDSQWMDVGKDLEAMYTGAMTPQDVVDTIAKRRNEQAELQRDPGWE